MNASLNRIILYVQDVERLANFYREALQLPVVETIEGEWAVLRAGVCELALHRVGKPYRVADASSWKVETNAKIVFSVTRELADLRDELIRKGVPMGRIKSYPGLTGSRMAGPALAGRPRLHLCPFVRDGAPLRLLCLRDLWTGLGNRWRSYLAISSRPRPWNTCGPSRIGKTYRHAIKLTKSITRRLNWRVPSI